MAEMKKNENSDSCQHCCEVNSDKTKYFSLGVQGLVTFVISSSISLYSPFYPKLAQEKGASASVYGFILGTNCLTAFLVTPVVGKNLDVIGPRFAYIMGIFICGVCCLLTGFLDEVSGGVNFISLSIAIRVISAIGNAGIITTSFCFIAHYFPKSLAMVFSLNRSIVSVGQMVGPALGGALIELGGFRLPFVTLGIAQIIVAVFCIFILPECQMYDKSKKGTNKKSLTLWNVFKIPSIYISFSVFIVITMANGFLSVTLEPQILRHYAMHQFYKGLIFGMKDGTSSIATPGWGWLCDHRKAVKPTILVCYVIVSLSFVILGPLPGVTIHGSLWLHCVALGLNGVGIAGLQVSGVIDAYQEIIAEGYPDDPVTHGCVAGLWSSFSGLGRSVSRSLAGILIDYCGFQYSTAIVCGFLFIVTACTGMFICFRCCRKAERKVSLLTSMESETGETKSLLGSNVDIKSNKLMISKEFHQSQSFVAAL